MSIALSSSLFHIYTHDYCHSTSMKPRIIGMQPTCTMEATIRKARVSSLGPFPNSFTSSFSHRAHITRTLSTTIHRIEGYLHTHYSSSSSRPLLIHIARRQTFVLFSPLDCCTTFQQRHFQSARIVFS